MAIINNNLGGVTRLNESNDQENEKVSRAITKKLDLLDTKLDSLYKSIYISRPDNKNNMETIINQLDTSIDKLQSNELSVSGMSEVYY